MEGSKAGEEGGTKKSLLDCYSEKLWYTPAFALPVGVIEEDSVTPYILRSLIISGS